MVNSVSFSQPEMKAKVMGETLKSFMTLFKMVSQHVSTPGEVKEMIEISSKLRKATLKVIQETGDVSLKNLLTQARRCFSQSYGAALRQLKIKQY